MVPFMLLPPCLPSRATQYCYFIYFFYHIFILFFILFLFYHIISFNFFIYFYFLSSHFCYCLPAFLPDLPSLVIFGLVRSQKSFWCKIDLTFFSLQRSATSWQKSIITPTHPKNDLRIWGICPRGHIP